MKDYYMSIAQQPDGKYLWTVLSKKHTRVGEGVASTVEQALRDARNFIRHHQNEIFL